MLVSATEIGKKRTSKQQSMLIVLVNESLSDSDTMAKSLIFYLV